MTQFSFHPMNESLASEIVSWRYDEPYAFYNLYDAEAAFRTLIEPENRYFSVTDERENLIAFRCFGDDARVTGGDYSKDALDTGGGLRPDLTGQGLGISVFQAGLAFGRQEYRPNAFRATVAAFNRRALRVCERAGFQEVQRFNRPTDGKEFAVLTRDA